jgi:hypothetical protein
MSTKNWFVDYDSRSVPCNSESDAKLLARELIKKGPVPAGTLNGRDPSRLIEARQVLA